MREYSSNYTPPANLMLLETNANNEVTYYVDEDEDPTADSDDDRDSVVRAVQVNSPAFTFSYGNNQIIPYSKERNNYTAALTNYVQALVDKKKENNGLILYPVSTGNMVNSLVSGDNKSSVKSIKLKLYYTLLKP
jgi:hypothetical protein